MELQVFNNQELGFSLQYVVDANGEPWFPARKVASALEYKNTNLTIQKHVPQRDKTTLDDILSQTGWYNSDTNQLSHHEKLTSFSNEARL